MKNVLVCVVDAQRARESGEILPNAMNRGSGIVTCGNAQFGHLTPGEPHAF